MLKAIAPPVARVALVFNPATSPILGRFLACGHQGGAAVRRQVITTLSRHAPEIERAIGEFAKKPNGGPIILPDATTNAHHKTNPYPC